MATLSSVGEERTARVGDVLYEVGDATYPFIAIREGEVAILDALGKEILRAADGFIFTGNAAGADNLLETSVPGIFAAGDVRSGSTKRCAAAVGEGSMAVQLVHEHLSATVAHAR